MKKIISMLVMVIVMMTLSVNAFAVCESENNRPEVIGLNNVDVKKIVSLREKMYDNEIDYETRIISDGDIWYVFLDSEDYADEYYAIGFYDHFPSQEEIEVLWANRMTFDELSSIEDDYWDSIEEEDLY